VPGRPVTPPEEAVYVLGPIFGIFPTVAEVWDSPSDPEVKIFQFCDGCPWGRDAAQVTSIRIVGAGLYRVTRAMGIPPGYRAVFEGTTRPKPIPVEPDDDELPDIPAKGLEHGVAGEARCIGAIVDALKEAMPVRDLKRRTNAGRFRKGVWDRCLLELAEGGRLAIEERPGLNNRTRQWVVPTGVPTDITGK
jgi:hypothetical protein